MAGIFRRAYFPPQKKRYAQGSATADFEADASLGAITILGFAPAVVGGTGVTVTAGAPGAVTITGYPPTFGTGSGVTLTSGLGAVTITGFAPAFVSQPPALTPGLGTVTIAGFAPAITGIASVTLTPATAAVSITGHAPTVTAPGIVSVTGSGDDGRAKWLAWREQQRRKPKVTVAPAPSAIPPGTLSFMDLIRYLEAERQTEMNRPPLSPAEQALDDAEVERLLLEET
jgi:hypothetical protein